MTGLLSSQEEQGRRESEEIGTQNPVLSEIPSVLQTKRDPTRIPESPEIFRVGTESAPS